MPFNIPDDLRQDAVDRITKNLTAICFFTGRSLEGAERCAQDIDAQAYQDAISATDAKLYASELARRTLEVVANIPPRSEKRGLPQLCLSHGGSSGFTWPCPAELRALKQQLADSAGTAAEHAQVVVSPYRACPLGAHIDHQGGPVTAVALALGVLFAFVPNPSDTTVVVTSHNFPGTETFSLDDVEAQQGGGGGATVWGQYARGAAFALKKSGYKLATGLTGVLKGHPGADSGGISSSAAVGCAFLLALERVNGLAVSGEENVQLDRCIENEFLGLKNGILDQSAILLSRADHLTVIDCAAATHYHVPAPWTAGGAPPVRLLLAFSGLRKALVGGGTSYNERVDECARAAGALLGALGRAGGGGPPPLLGQVAPEDFARVEGAVPQDECLRRAQHFFGECARVRAGVDAFRAGDLGAVGRLMSESGASSIHKYECGCPPLIALREIMLQAPGVMGARFSGAGFRGCCIALVKSECAEAAAHQVFRDYCESQPDLAPDVQVMILDTCDGARIV